MHAYKHKYNRMTAFNNLIIFNTTYQSLATTFKSPIQNTSKNLSPTSTLGFLSTLLEHRRKHPLWRDWLRKSLDVLKTCSTHMSVFLHGTCRIHLLRFQTIRHMILKLNIIYPRFQDIGLDFVNLVNIYLFVLKPIQSKGSLIKHWYNTQTNSPGVAVASPLAS